MPPAKKSKSETPSVSTVVGSREASAMINAIEKAFTVTERNFRVCGQVATEEDYIREAITHLDIAPPSLLANVLDKLETSRTERDQAAGLRKEQIIQLRRAAEPVSTSQISMLERVAAIDNLRDAQKFRSYIDVLSAEMDFKMKYFAECNTIVNMERIILLAVNHISTTKEETNTTLPSHDTITRTNSQHEQIEN
jgi:hypothetical protein